NSLRSVQDFRFLDDADNRAAHVVFACSVEARHLCRLAADERTLILRAGLRKALDNLVEDARLQLARAEVIEEKQRLGAQHRDVIDAVVDEVLTDGVVPIHRERELQFGTDAIGAGNEHWPAIPPDVQRKQTSESTNFAEHATAASRTKQLGQGRFDLVPQID